MKTLFSVFVLFSISASGLAASLGDRVCHTEDAAGKNGWCGYITQELGDSVRIENFNVFCGKGGFLGICLGISGDCVGAEKLMTDDSGQKYSNPKSIIVRRACLD